MHHHKHWKHHEMIPFCLCQMQFTFVELIGQLGCIYCEACGQNNFIKTTACITLYYSSLFSKIINWSISSVLQQRVVAVVVCCCCCCHCDGLLFFKCEISEQITKCQILWTFLWYSKMELHQVATSLLNWCMSFYQQRHQINPLCLSSICGKVYDFLSMSFCPKLPCTTSLVPMMRFHQSMILFLYLIYI